MADTKISALTAVTAALAAQELPVNDAGTTKKLTVSQIGTLFGNTLMNQAVGAQSVSATTAYLSGSNITVPSGLLRVGTWFRWQFIVTKTGAGTTPGCAILLKIGAAGTTADATRLTLTLGTPTAAVDAAFFQVFATVRAIGSGTSAVIAGGLQMTHNLAATGFSTLPCEVVRATSSGFDSTPAGLIVGLSATTTTASVWSVEDLIASAGNL